MRILVAGARQQDAGKTTFTRGLLAATGAPGVKPRAANDRWYDHDAYRKAIGDGRLYGKDARLIARDQASARTPEAVNPIHRLWQQTPDAGGGMHDVPHRQFVVDRVGEDFVVNGNASIPPEIANALPVDEARRVHSIAEMNRAVTDLHQPLLERFEERLADRASFVVESYGDIATPVESIAFDTVAVVEPGRVRYYDGERYGQASAAAASSPREGTKEPIVSDVVRTLDPIDSVALSPLPTSTRTDASEITKAYRHAYERAFSAAE